jgi:hypothetical protein
MNKANHSHNPSQMGKAPDLEIEGFQCLMNGAKQENVLNSAASSPPQR